MRAFPVILGQPAVSLAVFPDPPPGAERPHREFVPGGDIAGQADLAREPAAGHEDSVVSPQSSERCRDVVERMEPPGFGLHAKFLVLSLAPMHEREQKDVAIFDQRCKVVAIIQPYRAYER